MVAIHTHTLTTLLGRRGGPGPRRSPGRAWGLGGQQVHMRGLLAGRTRSPGLWDRQPAQAGAASTGAAARALSPHLEGQLQIRTRTQTYKKTWTDPRPILLPAK